MTPFNTFNKVDSSSMYAYLNAITELSVASHFFDAAPKLFFLFSAIITYTVYFYE